MWFLMFAVFVLLLLIFKWKKVFSYWKDRDVEYVSPFRCFRAFTENVLRLNSSSHVFRDVYCEFQNKRYVGSYNFFRPVLLIRDVELVKRITVKDHAVFHSHSDIIPLELDPMWSRNIVALADRDVWKSKRGSLTPFFTIKQVKNLFSTLKQFSEKLVEHLIARSEGQAAVVEMREVCKRLSCDISNTYSFGVNSDSINNPDSEMYTMTDKAFMVPTLYGIRYYVDKLFPKLLKWTGVKVFSDEVRHFFTNIMKQSIKIRAESNFTGLDVINLLLELHKVEKSRADNLDSQVFEDIMAQALILTFAGYDTVTSALSSLIYELTVHPDIQKKLHEDILNTIENFNGILNYDSVMAIEYLDNVIDEVMRMHPVTAIIDRQATKDYVIEPKNPDEKTLLIEKGTPIWILHKAIQMDPNYFPNPTKFDPARFSKENRKNIEPYSFIPFGSGPRMCLGSRLGLMKVKLVAIELLLNFELLPTKKTYVKDAYNTYNLRQHGVWVHLIPRKPHTT
ncbi:cytochrome P450 9e2-like isoform X2 [Photinus pyralis]|uniref:cytochrome P450 9e2-like isoform X2 n=1 Tax=Photinus pyralis TaxID=7054 RepID=UPI001266F699|nr:cytochrome P450 9e2-like isoform X2 [Photinus pyralis]